MVLGEEEVEERRIERGRGCGVRRRGRRCRCKWLVRKLRGGGIAFVVS